MKKFIETLKNIWKIKELRNRILFTLALLAVYRFGSFVLLPGVVPDALANSLKTPGGGQNIFDLISLFTGGAFSKGAIFALGIMPYITASIIIQLMGFAVPYFQRLQQKEGESGRKKITQITRGLTVLITLVQGGGYLKLISGTPGAISPEMPLGLFWIAGIIILSSGTIFAMWLGERITDKGIGNGISLLIMIGIIASLPQMLALEFVSQFNGGGGILFVLEMALFFVVVLATILIVQGVRKIPIQFAKRMVGRGASAMPAAGARDYIPLKVNAAGVMPIIFAQAIMFLPATIATFFVKDQTQLAEGILAQLQNPFSFISSVIAFLLVVVFTYIYTALLVNPQQYAEYLKRQNAFIPGIKPGKNTADFIDTVTTRVTLPGSIFLGLITILPAVAVAFGVNQGFAIFFGGTSLLILVAVVLDTLQQIESHLLMRRYDGLVKSGRLKGRSGMQGIGAGM